MFNIIITFIIHTFLWTPSSGYAEGLALLLLKHISHLYVEVKNCLQDSKQNKTNLA